MKKSKKGISLIVLIITIVIMIILAGAIILTLSNSGIISQTQMGMFKNNVASYKDELSIYVANEILNDTSFKAEDFSRDSNLIKTHVKSMSDVDSLRFMIIEGELVYINNPSEPLFTIEEIKALKAIGVKPSEYNYVAKEGNTMSDINYTDINVYINPKPEIEDTDNFYFKFNEYMLETPFSIIETNGLSLEKFEDTSRNDSMAEMVYFTEKKSAIIEQPDEMDEVTLTIQYNGYKYLAGETINIIGGWTKVALEIDESTMEATIILNSCFANRLPVLIRDGNIEVSTGAWFTMLGRYASTTPYEIAE